MGEPLKAALRAGDLRKQLETLRDFLADRLEEAPPRDQAPLAAQLRAILDDLNGLPVPKGESKLDDLSRRRAARRAAPADATGT